MGHLLADIEKLRVDRGVDTWLVFGMSWGTTLGLAYAENCPERVIGLVLVGAALGRPSEVDWLYKTIAPLFPEHYERFIAGLSTPEREQVVATYRQRVEDPDAGVRAEFARRWTEWDWA
ncbi:MAG: alpha/beta fold hydrolase, partial [Actinobacteria bacterium]|nr:alpha/beta fold hydrolase [Actinomycetota bacterium]